MLAPARRRPVAARACRRPFSPTVTHPRFSRASTSMRSLLEVEFQLSPSRLSRTKPWTSNVAPSSGDAASTRYRR
jgi:hypothetical protein